MNELDKVLGDYKQKGYLFDPPSEIKSGKEATVYCVVCNEKEYALKIYKDPEQRAFKNKTAYLEGKFYRNPSIKRAILKNNRFAKKFVHESWVRREFYILQSLSKLGASIPKVHEWTTNSILMDFIGHEHIPAPRLVDVILEKGQANDLFDEILNSIKIFLKFGIVHGDLSEFNILYWDNHPFIIDFPQAIDIRNNPDYQNLLHRDLDNITKFFSKFTKIDAEKVYNLLK